MNPAYSSSGIVALSHPPRVPTQDQPPRAAMGTDIQYAYHQVASPSQSKRRNGGAAVELQQVKEVMSRFSLIFVISAH